LGANDVETENHPKLQTHVHERRLMLYSSVKIWFDHSAFVPKRNRARLKERDVDT
jgi:hypothetical protein